MPPRPPLDELLELYRSLILASGVTTANGNGAFTSFVDARLIGAVGIVNTTAVIFPGQPLLAQVRDTTVFNAGTGEVTVSAAFSAQVLAGTPYVLLAMPPTVAEVAAIAANLALLMADVGDASASTLGSLYAILGNPPAAQTFLAMVGYQGALSLADKLTAARAALLDQITALRLAELDAANIPADVDTLLARLTALRAGYLDNINQAGLLQVTAARAALLDQITALRMAELDAANIPADVDTLLVRLTALRAGYLDNINNAQLLNITAARLGYIDLLADAINGLAAIKAEVEGLAGAAMRGTDGAALAASWTAALATALGNYTAARAGYLDNINQAGLLQVTAARAALLDQITALRMAELDAANIPANVDTLLTRLSAVRAGYLDNLSGGAVALAASWTAALATALGNYTAARAGYLDNINQAGLLQVTAARAALLDQITALRMAELDAANIPADTDPKVMGRSQIKARTIDLNQAAATYDLFTATAQDVVVEKLVLRCPALVAGGALTSISIQSDDATPIVLIDNVAGAVANLTSEAQLAWTGAMLLDAGTGAKIRLTIAGGATGVAYVCDVIAECRAVVAGGYLA